MLYSVEYDKMVLAQDFISLHKLVINMKYEINPPSNGYSNFIIHLICLLAL